MEIIKGYAKNIEKISLDDAEYPEQLRNISKPPEFLYCMGKVELIQKTGLAVVGSRKCSEYGKQIAMRVGKKAAEKGIVIISGMAKGIDGFAHLGVIKNDGDTIAVLGNGVDICYPSSNKHIYEHLIKDGLIVSELPPGFKARPYTFPKRNRIIAGLSQAICVVEAGTDSGSLITAEIGIQQGRDVFAVPGNITSSYSLGTNKLISDGAICVSVIDDMFLAMGAERTFDQKELEQLGHDEEILYRAIGQGSEVSIDWLCAKTGMSAIQVSGLISILEMKGLICYSLGKVFIL